MHDVRDVTVVERKHWWRVSLGQASVLVWKSPPVRIECDPQPVTFPPSEIDTMLPACGSRATSPRG